tara:strand:+ start:146 stop:532 length:387 start_codon:yes stop_codon:yes gene_type:complete
MKLMASDLFQKLADKYPFITLCIYASNEYVGIVQNRDDAITTIYDFGAVTNQDSKRQFIDLANTWWWESNRSIPINIFLRGEWAPFRSTLRTFANKDLEILHGPICSLNDIARKKSKRKSITLVRRID